MITPNATIKKNANGRAGQVLHEDKKINRYHIMPTDKIMLPEIPAPPITVVHQYQTYNLVV